LNNQYYALSYTYGTERRFIRPDWMGDTDVRGAARYQSAISAATEASQNGWTGITGFAIVRVTETQTGTTTVETNKRVLDATKPCVIYNVRLKQYGVVRPDKTISGTTALTNATVFTDLADAILALSSGVAAVVTTPGYALSPTLDIVHVHQVALEPTFSYTWEVL
jgi:hypothetical protein